ncbi:MAG: nucleotidyl transferase AbiEii/AbiGii toxin family protein [Muribaculaceae bacterium]|nr:nucleotidyl transferase AbiEii/AbiGii toxin family protein [Bacteroidaceae bacterium]MBQ9077570.1 nucleotidyl transferase AbiEii/AbiGii toxin family protein [Muribaculaceae bacterium]MBR2456730.1 nucleotidyl transferase AbiEii/AbiGii toxin family protein [Bacteroidaceae bacterium]
MKYTDLSADEQREVIQRVQAENRLQLQIIEKDWWVTAVLRALFSLPYSEHISFKGGTNLSKCWNLIERFSEDADIAIDREYLGFGGTLSKTQISDKLRRAACSFVRETLQYDLAEKLIENGVSADKFKVNVNITPVTTTDPEIIEVEYQSAFNTLPYIRSKVIIEVSGRSMNEPVVSVGVSSFIDDVFTNAPFAEPKFDVRAVVPERTFLEKVFLLHEEFSKPSGMIRTERMSRHLYDIAQMMDTPIVERALLDENLYKTVIDHRRMFIGLKGFDYSTLLPQTLSIVPQGEIREQWKEDYKVMQETMIYGDSPSFDELIIKIQALNDRIRQLNY